MGNFLSLVCAPAIQQVVETSFFRKTPFVRFGRLYLTVNLWVFQQAGLLGFSLRDQPSLLVKLISRDPYGGLDITTDAAKEFLTTLKEMADEHVTNAGNDTDGFITFYAKTELRQIGIEINQLPPDKRLNDKIRDPEISSLMFSAWLNGAAFGYHYPELFLAVWNSNYRMVPVDEWTRIREMGVILSETQTDMPLEEATIEILREALDWQNTEAPLLFGEDDTMFLIGKAYPY
jgi:hypothetical protein